MKEKLQNFIALGNTEEAIQQLRTLAPALEDSLQQEILLQSGRFATYAREKRNGTLSQEAENIQLARINNALLSIIQRLPAKIPTVVTRKTNTWKWIITAIGIIVILTGLVMVIENAVTKNPETNKGSIQQETKGDQSPAVVGDDVKINYGSDWGDQESGEKPDSTQKQ